MKSVVDVNKLNEDIEEISLRPNSLLDYIGQNSIKNNLQIFIKAALSLNET